jgi:hypothetical protein
MPFGVDDGVWSRLVDEAVRGRYYLLLGAGASAGGVDGLGAPLPLGDALRDDLVEEFDLPAAAARLPLPRVFDAAKRRGAGKRFASVNEYFHERFSGCRAPEWFPLLCQVRWRRIWTLNIDDTLDNAYVSTRTCVQHLDTTHWSRPFYEESTLRNVTAVHLHGRARTLVGDDSENLVFSLDQYLDAAIAGHSWHKVFGDVLKSQPFVIVGAKLADELDFANVLRRGNASRESLGTPSVAVLRDIDEVQREELVAWGLIPVRATGEEFFKALGADMPAVAERIAAPVGVEELPPQALNFLAQFRRLEAQQEEERDPWHDLYAGHDPTWQDIVRDRDAEFQVARGATKKVGQALNRQISQRIFCLYGPRFTGKSAALLRAARLLIAEGANVYSFIGDERPNIGAIRWWAERQQPIVLLFDGLADFTPDMERLVDQLPADQFRVVVLGAEREGRVARLTAALPDDEFVPDSALRVTTLSNADINALLTRLRAAGRLGRISRLDRGGQVAFFRTQHGRRLFPAMASLERAEGFTARLREQYNAITKRPLQSAYAACCLVHSLGYATPLSLLTGSAGIGVRDLIRAAREDEPFAELVEVAGDKLKTRQRTLASLVTEDVLTPDDRFNTSSALATALAPHISPQTIAQRTLHARIARELMDVAILTDWLGQENVERWYEQQVALHDWNARFWEQRALAASERSSWDRAESYAERAVEIHPDPFTLNTLGVVLLRKALSFDVGSPVMWEYYERAVRALTESRVLGQSEYMHPFVTFFSYTIRVARRERDAAGGSVDPRLVREWNDWMFRARASLVFRREPLRAQLDEFERDWLLMAASD